MANLFDPNNPKTWPQNYKRRSTEAFTNKGVPARDLAESRAENRFASDAQTPVYDAGGDFNLRGMQTPYENYDISPGNVARTVASVLDTTHHISGEKSTGNPQNPHVKWLH